MAGATIPLTPAVHQMISVGPIPLFAETKGEIEYPIIRDVDTNCYERQNGSDMEVGSYAHRAILMSPDDIPSIEESALSPTELPFTVRGLRPADGAGARADAGDPHRRGRRHPARDQRAAVADARRDAAARARPRSRASGRCRRVWIKEAAGIARAVAEWATDGALGDRPARRRHLALLRPPAHAAPRRRALGRGLQPHLRDRPPDGAVALEPRGSAEPVLRAGAGARRGVLRDRRLGAAVVVRVEQAAARGVRRQGDAARGGVGVALVVADHQRRAPGDARPRGDDRPVGVRDLRRRRVGLAGVPAAGRARRVRRRGRPGRSTRRSSNTDGDVRDRPDDHAARRLALPRRHGRHGRDARHEVVRRPAACGRLGDAARHDLGVVHGRALGAAGARHPARRSPRRTSRTRASRSRAGAGSRSGRCA